METVSIILNKSNWVDYPFESYKRFQFVNIKWYGVFKNIDITAFVIHNKNTNKVELFFYEGNLTIDNFYGLKNHKVLYSTIFDNNDDLYMNIRYEVRKYFDNIF